MTFIFHTYPVISVVEKIPMGPPKFHEIKRSYFCRHYGHDKLKLYSLNDKKTGL